MRPTQWRRSTHVVVGVAVLLVVAAVVRCRGRAARAGTPATPTRSRLPRALATANPGIKPVADSAREADPRQAGRDPGAYARRSEPGRPDRQDHRCRDRDQLWAQGADVPMQPASVTKVLTTAAALLGLDRDARLTTTVMASDRRPGRRRAEGRRRPDAVGGAAGPGHLVPGRGTDQRPRRPGAAQRHQGDRGGRWTSAHTAARRWRPAGIRSTSTAATSRRWRR